MVDVDGLTKWYGEITALDRVDLRVLPGTIHGLLGPNGADKTTLLAALFGLVLPDEGRVRLFGRTRTEAGASWLDGVGGFVESPRFYPYLSGRRNLQILAGLDGTRDGGQPQHLQRHGLDHDLRDAEHRRHRLLHPPGVRRHYWEHLLANSAIGNPMLRLWRFQASSATLPRSSMCS